MKYCPVCESSKNLQLQFSTVDGNVYRCKKCTLGIFDGKSPKYAGADIEESRFVRFFKRYVLHYEMGYLKKRRSMKVLEIGSGSGELAKLLSSYGHHVTCNDIDRKSLRRISSGLKLKTLFGRIEELKIRNSSFDMIVLRHTFEHLDNPDKIIKTSRRILEKNGRIIITLPNYDSCCGKIMGKKWSGFSLPSHRSFWTGKSLDGFLKKNGFRVVKKKTLFSHYGLPMNLMSLVKQKTLKILFFPFFLFIGGSFEFFFAAIGRGQNLFIEAKKL